MDQKTLLQLAKIHTTPFVVVDHKVLRENYTRFRQHLPRVQVYYAVKANCDPAIVQTFYDVGASFDVASLAEFLIVHEKIFMATTIVQIFLPLLLAIYYISWIEGTIAFDSVQVIFVLVFLLPVLVKLVHKLVARIALKVFFKEKSSWKPVKKSLLVKIPIYTVLIAGLLVAATFVLMEIIGGLVFLVTW